MGQQLDLNQARIVGRIPRGLRVMGLDINGARFLLYARTLDVDFTRTATVGRQGLHLRRRDLKDSFEAFRYAVDERTDRCDLRQKPWICGAQLLMYLGARDVHSFDVYLSSWQRSDRADRALTSTRSSTKEVSLLDRVKRSTPVLLKRLLRRVRPRSRLGFDPRFLQPLDPTASARSPAPARALTGR